METSGCVLGAWVFAGLDWGWCGYVCLHFFSVVWRPGGRGGSRARVLLNVVNGFCVDAGLAGGWQGLGWKVARKLLECGRDMGLVFAMPRRIVSRKV